MHVVSSRISFFFRSILSEYHFPTNLFPTYAMNVTWLLPVTSQVGSGVFKVNKRVATAFFKPLWPLTSRANTSSFNKCHAASTEVDEGELLVLFSANQSQAASCSFPLAL